jgi:peptidoglycan/LPS O-acetylase OafA/YrhL
VNQQKDQHIAILDSLRAFAAISVCLYHFVCTTTGYIDSHWILNVFSVGKHGVQLFFVISGFVIPWAMFSARFKLRDSFRFLVKRIIRLEPPYVFSIVLTLVFLCLRTRLLHLQNDHVNISTTQVLLHFGYLIPFFENYDWLNNVYWTLAIEFQYYFLIALIFLPLIHSSIFLRIFIYLSAILLSFTTSQEFLPYWLPIFFIGILLFLFFAKIIMPKEFYMVLAALICVGLYKYPIASVVYSLVPVLCLLLWKDIKIIGFNFMGKFSYSIYLYHSLLGSTFINLMSHHFTTPIAKFVVIFIGFSMTIVGSWITFLLIENPSKKLSSKVKYKKLSF